MKYIKYTTIAIALLLSSCSGFLEEYSQETDYANSWEDLNETLLGNCYMAVEESRSIANTSDSLFFIHFMGDELEESTQSWNNRYIDYDSKGRVFGYFTWQQRVDQNDTYTGYNQENGGWTEIYRLINVANNIIYSLKSVPQTTDADKKGVLKVNGEAHFLRAFYYFWLVNLYGNPYSSTTATTDLGVPLKLSEKVEDKTFTRNTVQEVYDQILLDLQQAESDLSQTTASSSIYRANMTSVQFLLSRVYLYMQNWSKAAEYADKVINSHPDLVPLSKLQGSILSKTSVETIFSMGGNSLPCMTSYQYKGFSVSKDLYDAYSDDDLRKTNFWWTSEKFIGYTKVSPKNASSTDISSINYYYVAYNEGWEYLLCEVSDKFLFRSPEAYLIKAEAEAYLGNEGEARNAINTLREYRYRKGSNYEVTATGRELVKTIREERRKELALEGLRWFDLRRYNVCEKYPESSRIVHDYYYYESRNSIVKTEYHTFVLEPNDKAYTLPIPQYVINFNTGMPNNERPARTHTVTQATE
jgi:hypothetical protein